MMQHPTSLWRRTRSLLVDGGSEPLSPFEAYERWAATYRDCMNPVQELEDAALRRALPELAGRSVLDVGCGTGRVTQMALDGRAAHVAGVDPSLRMLEEARSRCGPSPPLIQGDVYALPFEASAFDVVTCALVLGHVERLDAALTEMNRVLRPGGCAVITGFHPFATLHGSDRTFQDAATGRTRAIIQHVHLFSDYVRAFRMHGWRMETFEEPLYAGLPLVFVLRAQKEVAT
jgi:malonyl-CoA O-methyltransferase